jgi:hypothetical protein
MIRSLWRTLVLGSLLGCAGAAQGPEAVALISGLAGAQQVVTLTNLHPQGTKLSAVNYQQDGLIPVCSAVTILSLSNEKLEFRVESSWQQYAYFYHKAAVEPFGRHLARYFGASCPQGDLAALSPDERRHVQLGEVAPGMSPSAVIFAIGYPPLSATPNLDAPKWRYWRSRLRTMLVVFGSDGRVAKIER